MAVVLSECLEIAMDVYYLLNKDLRNILLLQPLQLQCFKVGKSLYYECHSNDIHSGALFGSPRLEQKKSSFAN